MNRQLIADLRLIEVSLRRLEYYGTIWDDDWKEGPLTLVTAQALEALNRVKEALNIAPSDDG